MPLNHVYHIGTCSCTERHPAFATSACHLGLSTSPASLTKHMTSCARGGAGGPPLFKGVASKYNSFGQIMKPIPRTHWAVSEVSGPHVLKRNAGHRSGGCMWRHYQQRRRAVDDCQHVDRGTGVWSHGALLLHEKHADAHRHTTISAMFMAQHSAYRSERLRWVGSSWPSWSYSASVVALGACCLIWQQYCCCLRMRLLGSLVCRVL